jgi:hypothetical protein
LLHTQANEDISKYLFQVKVLLYGDGGEFELVQLMQGNH